MLVGTGSLTFEAVDLVGGVRATFAERPGFFAGNFLLVEAGHILGEFSNAKVLLIVAVSALGNPHNCRNTLAKKQSRQRHVTGLGENDGRTFRSFIDRSNERRHSSLTPSLPRHGDPSPRRAQDVAPALAPGVASMSSSSICSPRERRSCTWRASPTCLWWRAISSSSPMATRTPSPTARRQSCARGWGVDRALSRRRADHNVLLAAAATGRTSFADISAANAGRCACFLAGLPRMIKNQCARRCVGRVA